MPPDSRPWLEPLWEAGKQSGEEGFRAAQHHPLSQTWGLCDPARREKTPSTLRESQRGLWWSWQLQIPWAWLPSPSRPFWSLLSASCSQGQPGLCVHIKREPPLEARWGHLLQGESIYLHQRVWLTSLRCVKAAVGCLQTSLSVPACWLCSVSGTTLLHPHLPVQLLPWCVE